MFVLNFNNKQAEEIAKDFLSQSYSVIKIEKSVLVDQTWIVELLVSSYGKDTVKKIKINNKTGHIMGFE
ncbi:hypothetical protein DYY66_2278 [Candidatus Nitrosotalea sp. FS]|uniref:hypothetical protein n=1 Tax=Candidatus Nitrosotalea sp. FS TaxID=2341021 RepID=UPI0014095729|nr:hypothetical protein [Candidatus Nitrosotalea sp. FS]NHH97986.1 hypothetical protein [Candidatus Nitrosotalea sp. FS]